MTVKDNQPRLLADLTTFFSRRPGPGQDLRQVAQTTKAHGRLETRTLWASADVQPYLDWPGAQQALGVERHIVRLSTGQVSTQRLLGITSLAPDQLDLAKVLQRWRGHWSIEHRIPWVRNLILAEDACRAIPLTCLRSWPVFAMPSFRSSIHWACPASKPPAAILPCISTVPHRLFAVR